ncbi:MAG TPA: histidine kinase dimerization/phosphoacceptor domain -containing protein, partial [Candidatus Cloacimonadota bacterium]|nr:histidine kinase dimerization/phosphoacceptor domain -containing protein [Candidatus Cloacimonadota bacterium]
IRNSLHEKVIMLREIHHRVKNNLQIISSIISLQMRNVADDTQAVDLLMNTQNRIYSMSLIHEKLYIENNLANIDFEDYIRGLVDYLISSYQDQGRRVYSRIDAANICLNVTTAIPCGLLINEIISNSLKHAFQDQQKGEVFVYMHQDEGGTLHLKAGNNGAEFDFKESNNGTSIGLRLIELLSRQLHGKLEVDSHEGVCYTLTFEEIGKGDMA